MNHEVNSVVNKKVSVGIWGACVSRELFNYIKNAEVTRYIFQNPLNTLFFEGYNIEESLMDAVSPFSKRMLILETQKTAVDYFNTFDSDYLIIDIADCRNNWWQKKDNPNVRICNTVSFKHTLDKNECYKELFENKSIFSVSLNEWRDYVDKFCTLIMQKYDEDHIILNKFSYSYYYLEKGKLIKYPDYDLVLKQESLTNTISNMIIDRLPNIKVVDEYLKPIGAANHYLGLNSLHYIDEVYFEQARKMCEKLGIDN